MKVLSVVMATNENGLSKIAAIRHRLTVIDANERGTVGVTSQSVTGNRSKPL